jgi:hypothetical protein
LEQAPHTIRQPRLSLRQTDTFETTKAAPYHNIFVIVKLDSP